MASIKRWTAITDEVRRIVRERDGDACIICGAPAEPVAHVVSRAQMGRGDIPQNIVCLCWRCHRAYDGTERDVYGGMIRDYLRAIYPDWNDEEMKVKK